MTKFTRMFAGVAAVFTILCVFHVRDLEAGKVKEAYSDFTNDTGRYFMSYLGLSWFDHFDHGSARERDFSVNAPILGFRGYGADVFSTFNGTEVKEAGVSFNLTGLRKFELFKKVLLTPYVFKNYEADAYGTGIQATIKLR